MTSPPKSPLRSFLARSRHLVVRRILHSRAAHRGFTRGDLDRFDEYLESGFGLTTPDYAHATQYPRTYFPGLPSKPFYDVSELDWAPALEGAAAEIIDEFEQVQRADATQRHPQKLAEPGKWNVYYFNLAGRRDDEHHAQCPETSTTLGLVPGAGEAGSAYFSILKPART